LIQTRQRCDRFPPSRGDPSGWFHSRTSVGNYLGLGLANLVNLFNPSMIVLDQRLELAGQGLLDQVLRIVKRQALNHSTADLDVRFARLGEEAGVLGVALMLIEQHFEIPRVKPPRFMIESIATPVQGGSALQTQ